jgi:CIC family chloride channel protein
VGREGPIVQISAAFASWLGGAVRVSRWQRATLVAAGGGAGIAATFNTPIGGVLFAVEVLLHEMSVRTLVPVVLSTATATYVGERLFGNGPAFYVPPVRTLTGAEVLPAYLVIGGLMALVSVAFIRALYGAEDAFEKYLPWGPYLRHAIGMLGVGVILDLLMSLTGHYYVQGVGYATIADVLGGQLSNVGFLLVLFALKLLTTCLTLGSGGSGGVFSPSLFMGATLGGAFGILLRAAFPGIPFDPAALALAGMAGLVAGATGAALTAIVMIFEMTRDYSVVLPMTLTVAVSYGVRRALLAPSIYTMKLVRRGHYIPDALQANPQLVLRTADLPMASATAIAEDADPRQLARPDAPAYFVLIDGARVAGVIPHEWALGHRDLLSCARSAEELARRDFVVARGDTTVFELIGSMQRARAGLAVVRPAAAERPGEVLGIVTREHLWEAMAEGMKLFCD